jgi:hypothetical protein
VQRIHSCDLYFVIQDFLAQHPENRIIKSGQFGELFTIDGKRYHEDNSAPPVTERGIALFGKQI